MLLFLTTFDVFSQAAAKRLESFVRSHTPRLNAVAVVLEAPQYAELARSFRDTLALGYPVVLADQASLQSHPVFSAVKTVPAWIFLDRQAKVATTGTGALSIEQLRQAARLAEM